MAIESELQPLLSQYILILRALRRHGIASLADIAEHAFAQALGGERVARGKKGHDLIVPDLGRVQVKERCLPDDGRLEERLHLRNLEPDCCDYLGAIIFDTGLRVKKATLAPYPRVWELIAGHRDPERKVRFGMIAVLPGAVDVTERLRAVLPQQIEGL